MYLHCCLYGVLYDMFDVTLYRILRGAKQALSAALLLGPYMHEEISEWLQGGSCSQDLHA